MSNGPVADLFLVFATVDREKGPNGVTGFLVEKDTPGLSIGAHASKMGLKTSPMSDVFFSDCEIPEGIGSAAKVRARTSSPTP